MGDRSAPPLLDALLEVLRHPLRSRVLTAVAERPGATVNQIARRLDETPRRVRHQLGRLVDAGLVNADGSTPRRNARERHYRAAMKLVVSDEEMVGATLEDRRRLAVASLMMLVDDIRRATSSQTLATNAGNCEIRIPGELDKLGGEEMSRVFKRMMKEVEVTMRASAHRLQLSGERGSEVVAGLLLLGVPPWAPVDEDPPASMWLDRDPPSG